MQYAVGSYKNPHFDTPPTARLTHGTYWNTCVTYLGLLSRPSTIRKVLVTITLHWKANEL
jgi:hypothetical protein